MIPLDSLFRSNIEEDLFCRSSSNDLYPFHGFKQSLASICPSALLGERVSATIWHKRLGQLASSILDSYISSSNLLLKKSFDVSLICEYCHYGKSCKIPFQSFESVSTNPLEVIYSDVWSIASIISICKFTCYVLFIDDYSKYIWLFLLKKKVVVFDALRLFKMQVENLLSTKIITFRSDGVGEYMSSHF